MIPFICVTFARIGQMTHSSAKIKLPHFILSHAGAETSSIVATDSNGKSDAARVIATTVSIEPAFASMNQEPPANTSIFPPSYLGRSLKLTIAL